MSDVASYVNLEVSSYQEKALLRVLEHVFTKAPILQQAVIEGDIAFRVLEPREKFVDVDRGYRQFDDERGYCQGLYDHSTAKIVLREIDENVVAHEIVHRIDFLNGAGYETYSEQHDAIRKVYLKHKRDGGYVSNYASVSIRESWAETIRAMLGFSMQPPGRKTDLERIRAIDPEIITVGEAFLRKATIAYADLKALEPTA